MFSGNQQAPSVLLMLFIARPLMVTDTLSRYNRYMSYEVYIDVRHYPRHADHLEKRLSSGGKFAYPEGGNPTNVERMRTVVAALRDAADTYDPDTICTHCDEARGNHYGYPDPLVRCFGQYGPITEWDWWDEVKDDRQGVDSLASHGHAS